MKGKLTRQRKIRQVSKLEVLGHWVRTYKGRESQERRNIGESRTASQRMTKGLLCKQEQGMNREGACLSWPMLGD